MTNSEIIVNDIKICECQSKMSNLARSLSGRKAKVSFVDSKGDVVENLVDTVKILNNITSALAVLASNTADTIELTRNEFTSTDETLASWISLMGR